MGDDVHLPALIRHSRASKLKETSLLKHLNLELDMPRKYVSPEDARRNHQRFLDKMA